MPHPAPARRPPPGFTLVELIVVLAIIGSLLALAVPRYFGVLDQGRLSVQQANRHSLREAIDKHYADRGRYPDNLDDLVNRRYLRELPVDPVTGRADWRLLPPPDGLPGRIHDVLPARSATPDDAPPDAASTTTPDTTPTPATPAAAEPARDAPPPAPPPQPR